MVPSSGNGHSFLGPGNLDLTFYNHANKFIVINFSITVEIGARDERINIISDITILGTPI